MYVCDFRYYNDLCSSTDNGHNIKIKNSISIVIKFYAGEGPLGKKNCLISILRECQYNKDGETLV